MKAWWSRLLKNIDVSICWILPSLESARKNRTVDQIITKLEQQTEFDVDEYCTLGVYEEQQRTRRQTLTIRGQTLAVTMTILISLLLGGAGVTRSFWIAMGGGSRLWLTFALFMLSIIYFMLAANLSLNVITTQKSFGAIPNWTKNFNETEQEKRALRAIDLKCNHYIDIKLHNNLFASIGCIRRAIITLILAILLGLLFILSGNGDTDNIRPIGVSHIERLN